MGSTKKLYFYDNHVKAFSAQISRIHNTDSHLEIVLDQTAFRPPSGGQDGDHGKIFSISGNEAQVLEVKEKGAEIIHICSPKKGTFTVGESVNGEIDWLHRYALMQTHTGQHIFASALQEIGKKNQTPITVSKVHIHPGFGDMFINLPELDWKLIFKAETRVNEIISKNVPISTNVLSNWDALKQQYPSFRTGLTSTPPKGEIRVVEVKGFDVSTCTGSHLSNSNEVVVLKLLNVKKIKDQQKVEFAVGDEALKKTRTIVNQLLPITHQFSMGLEQIPQRLTHANQEIEKLTRENKKLKTKLVPFLSQQILSTPQTLEQGDFFEKVLQDFDLAILQTLAAKIVDQSTKPTICFLSTKSSKKWFMVIRTKTVSKPLSQILNQEELQIQGTIRETDAILIAENDTALKLIKNKLIALIS